MPNFWQTGTPHILKIQWFPLSKLVIIARLSAIHNTYVRTSKSSVHNWPFAASYVRFYEICTILHVNGHFLTVLALILTALVHWGDSHIDSGSYYWYTHLPSETLHILSRLRNFKPFRHLKISLMCCKIESIF